MSAQTPGPWHIGLKYHTDVYADRSGHAIARAVNPQHEGECEANARLIAAAPELLTACQLFIAYEKANVTDDDVAMMVAYSVARKAIHAAIAKATGGAQ